MRSQSHTDLALPNGPLRNHDKAGRTARNLLRVWIQSLGQRQFVGTESRLMAVFALLREIAEGTEIDPAVRLVELEKRKAQIDQEIARIRDGDVRVMDSTQIKDRFLQMATTARSLLSDFREVEQNFRLLDRSVREQIASWDGPKSGYSNRSWGAATRSQTQTKARVSRPFGNFLMSQAALVVLMFTLVGGTLCNAAQLVSNEATKLQALRAIFPNMRISVLPDQPDEHPSPVTDPLQRVIATVQDELQHGGQYSVVGPVSKNEEDSASDIIHQQRPASNERRVRMEVYRWTTDEKGNQFLVAFLSYTFPNANPPRCCTTVGKVVLLSNKAERVLDSLDKMPYAFTMFTSIQFLKVNATAAEKLMVGADFSGVGTIGINSAVFNVEDQKLNPLLCLTTMVLSEAEPDDLDVHTMTFDARRTALAKGNRFFFTKKTYAVGKQVLTTPRTQTVEFPVAKGVLLDWQ